MGRQPDRRTGAVLSEGMEQGGGPSREGRAVTIDLTDEERVALDNMLTDEIAVSRYPLSPRIEMLKRVRAKLRGEEARGRLSPMRARASGIAMRCQRDRCIRKKPRRKAGLRLVRKRVASFTGRSASFERDLHAMVS